MMKSSASQAVANFLITSFWSFLNRPRIKIAPTAGSQVMIERILFVNISPRRNLCQKPDRREGSWRKQLISLKTLAGRPSLKLGLLTLRTLNKIERHGQQQSNHHHQRVILR